jgi:cyclohexa-1,5-dienecarbonyl-CoA hydratase
MRMQTMTRPSVASEIRGEGGWLRLLLDEPPGNILTRRMIGDLRHALNGASARRGVRLISIEGQGPHFSYGASVEEHRPDQVGTMLPEFHQLLEDLLDVAAPTAAIVRGRCLGGGLELALACDVVCASDDALLGAPEVQLGVFAPAAAALLPVRIGASRAARALLSGEPRPARWWLDAGLVACTAPTDMLDARVSEWYEETLAGKSAAALAHAAAASREVLRRSALPALYALERRYLGPLMQTADAVEGCAAFLEKRPPRWRHR